MAAAISAILALIGFTPANADTLGGGVYVAMGDSYAAGPLILPQSDLFTCVRSSINYRSLLAQRLRAKVFRDASCSNATTKDFTAAQPGFVSGSAAPQYDALSADTTLVTVQIGGNDIGILGLAFSCLNFAGLGQSCAAANTAGRTDRFAAKVDDFAPAYGTVIEQIRQRAPHAKIVLVGYPTGIRHDGCWPFIPMSGQDANYLQSIADRLNARMAEQATMHGASYVDLRTPSIGHDACQWPGTRWIEGLLPGVVDDGFTPMHPNATGMTSALPAILSTLGIPA